MNTELKKESGAKVWNRTLHKIFNESGYCYRNPKGKDQPGSTAETRETTMGQKTSGLLMTEVKWFLAMNQQLIFGVSDDKEKLVWQLQNERDYQCYSNFYIKFLDSIMMCSYVCLLKGLENYI